MTARTGHVVRGGAATAAACALALCPAGALPAQDTAAARAIDAARAGGVVVACRHAITDSQDEDEMTLVYADPRTQRRLSRAGEQQAAAIGNALRSLGIEAEEVIASPMQRARRTAELIFGTAQLDSAWHTRGEDFSGWKRERRLHLLARPTRGGNRFIFSHIGTMYDVLPSIRGELDEGDCVVVKPLGRTHTIIAVVPWRAWLRAAAGDREDGAAPV